LKKSARREFSAGGVIFKKVKGSIKIAITARNNSSVWCLPKGKIEPRETPQHAAARELMEETGLEGEAVCKIGNITYRFFSEWDHANVYKLVQFYLFRCIRGSIRNHDNEVDRVKWFTPEEALKVMTYPSERGIVRKAKRRLQCPTSKIPNACTRRPKT